MKKAVCHAMIKSRAPKCLRDYCMIYQCKLRNFIAHPIFRLNGHTPYENVTGHTPDISKYLDYSWYDTIWYYDQDMNFPEDHRKLGKWLGVVHRVGQALCYYILNDKGVPIVCSTIQALSAQKMSNA
jgi:hypothetical protein